MILIQSGTTLSTPPRLGGGEMNINQCWRHSRLWHHTGCSTCQFADKVIHHNRQLPGLPFTLCLEPRSNWSQDKTSWAQVHSKSSLEPLLEPVTTVITYLTNFENYITAHYKTGWEWGWYCKNVSCKQNFGDVKKNSQRLGITNLQFQDYSLT